MTRGVGIKKNSLCLARGTLYRVVSFSRSAREQLSKPLSTREGAAGSGRARALSGPRPGRQIETLTMNDVVQVGGGGRRPVHERGTRGDAGP